MQIKVSNASPMQFKEVTVQAHLPENLTKLRELAYNLWWVWNSDAKNLFRQIDNEAWHRAQSNPVLLLNMLGYDKLVELSKDRVFMAQLDSIYEEFKDYMNVPRSDRPSIAYFSMEYGLSSVLKIYSGGLGILAGDYLKEASDSNVDMTAIGFLYRYGYFTQTLSPEGQQIANYEAQNFNNLPITQVRNEDGSPMVIDVPYPDRFVHAYLWKVAVGRITLYLLDTDNDMNSEWDRQITHQLYGGDWENRIKQEILLGIGGVLALNKLGIKKDVYHCNEGHAALMGLQRMVDLVSEGLNFRQALEVVRASGLYTCHTPVPAGHDYFEEGLFYKYMHTYADKLGIEWGDLIGLGRANPEDGGEKFSMSVFALNTCQEANGVSWLHGEVSKKMFSPVWKGYYPEELHVGYVTNGVHMPTWAASEWKKVYRQNFPKGFWLDQSNKDMWREYLNIPDEMIWGTRMYLKKRLIDYIRHKFQEDWMKSQGDPARIVRALNEMSPSTLIIGFGRRFATYKRAHLLFTDLERLERLVNNPNYPVQFLFTGKAHPADGAGQDLIKRIIEISRMPQFLGKIIFLENYDMDLAKRLISGVDIWLNTPTRPLEASGTSGEKAQMNGVLNFSVLDGWWYEGYVPGAGWALTDKRTYENQAHQDQLDAATIYQMLESEIIPMYYARNAQGYSPAWVAAIKKSVTEITPRFTTKRMMDDYFDRFYCKLAKRHATLSANNYELAKQIVSWKENMVAHWDEISVVSSNVEEVLAAEPMVGEKYKLDVVLDTKGLGDKGVGVELVVIRSSMHNNDKLYHVQEFDLKKAVGTILHFETTYLANYAGALKFGLRMFPKNDLLPHRMDFCYVRWL